MGVKYLDITVGNVGEWGYIRKAIAENMINDLKNE